MESDAPTLLEAQLQIQNSALEKILLQLTAISRDVATIKLTMGDYVQAATEESEPNGSGEPEHADDVDVGNF